MNKIPHTEKTFQEYSRVARETKYEKIPKTFANAEFSKSFAAGARQ
jgi:hypothetical protein